MERREERPDPLGKREPGPPTVRKPRSRKDEIFTSEEAVQHDKDDIARFDREGIVRSFAEERSVPNVPSTDDYH